MRRIFPTLSEHGPAVMVGGPPQRLAVDPLAVKFQNGLGRLDNARWCRPRGTELCIDLSKGQARAAALLRGSCRERIEAEHVDLGRQGEADLALDLVDRLQV